MRGTRRLGAALTLAAAATLTGCAGENPTLQASTTTCAHDWHAPPAGLRTFTVHNDGTIPIRVQIVSAIDAGVYGQLYLLDPGTTQSMEVILTPGSYDWQCIPATGVGAISTTATVTGTTRLAPHVLEPLTPDQAEAMVLTYTEDITQGLHQLATDTQTLTAAVDSGTVATAKTDWLTAHLDYARLGAAYDTFGAYADEIDGRPDGLPQGRNDPGFTGFLRLEYGLWSGQPVRQLRAVAATLNSDVAALVRAFPSQRIPASDLPLRAHEILENTLQFELTGDTDMGSHTNLATAWANVQGDQTVLAVLAPELSSRDPHLLASAEAGDSALASTLLGYRVDGQWTPLQSLTMSQHESLDAALSGQLETLSQFPDVLEVTGQT